MNRLLTLAAAGAMTSLSSTAWAEGLRVTIDGIRNSRGNIVITAFSEARAYETLDFWQAEAFAAIPARPGKTAHAFPDLTAGPYAIVLFYDENGDKGLSFSEDQLLEGIGVSDARSSQDGPGFAEATVQPGHVTIHVSYDG
ncbi:DUF2141 domain-containing protein [Roseobacteraceae bacterium NS-SX3]